MQGNCAVCSVCKGAKDCENVTTSVNTQDAVAVLSCNAGLRIGTEHEKLGYNTADNTRIGYDVIQKLLQGLCDRFGWQPVMEGEYIIGAELDGQSVSLEPGGQFELSGAPLETLHMTCAETNNHLYQVWSLGPIVIY